MIYFLRFLLNSTLTSKGLKIEIFNSYGSFSGSHKIKVVPNSKLGLIKYRTELSECKNVNFWLIFPLLSNSKKTPFQKDPILRFWVKAYLEVKIYFVFGIHSLETYFLVIPL